MDVYLEEEEVNADQGGWSFTSKALLMSNVLVSLLIVIVISFIFMSPGGSAEADLGLQAGGDSRDVGEFNSEKPIVDEEKVMEDKVMEEKVMEDKEIVDKNILDDGIIEVPIFDQELEAVDDSVLQVVRGCLTQQITGTQCDETFVRSDIIDYCDGLTSLNDRCFVLAALMNSEILYCNSVSDEKLEGKCIVSVSGL